MAVQLLLPGLLLPRFISYRFLEQFPLSFFSVRFVNIHVVHLYSSVYITAAWKKSHSILLDRWDFHMINSLLIAVQASARHMTWLLVDETLLPRYMNLYTNFKGIYSDLHCELLIKTYVLRFVHVHVETNAFCSLLPTMLRGFGFGRCICKKYYVNCIVYLRNSFCRISSCSCFFSVNSFSFIRSIDVLTT